MSRGSKLAVGVALIAAVGCATHVAVTPTHRENMASQAKVLAIAARDFEDIVRQHRAEGAEEEAVRAVIDFHAQAENFAGTTVRWDPDRVDSDYEQLIKAWVKVKQTFPNLKADRLTQDQYARVQQEWEKLDRTSGYAGRKYEQKIEQGK
jgi:membrane-bound lytic murein transglycosylase B